jgi:catechol 2,3-dioxygenase-like lactoylglutathione lyase family enzyme
MIDRFHHLFIEPSDYEASLAFYRDVLGWTVTENWGGNGSGRGAMLSGGGIQVVVAERERERGTNAPSNAAGGSRFNVHLDIHDIDARFRALPKGDHVVVAPEATHWGTRWFVVRDPDGNRIAFEEVHGHDG